MIKFTPEELKFWDEVFKPMLYDKKGLNKKKVMKLLLAHHKNIQEVMKVYHHVTNGATVDISIPATKMIEAITELDNENLAAILKDEKEKWTKEYLSNSIEQVHDTCYVKMVAKLNQQHTSFEVITPMKKYKIVFDSNNNSVLSQVLPQEWVQVVQGACIKLLNEPELKEIMVTK